MKAIIYCRVSSKEQVSNLSLVTQEEQCRAYCERQGLEVDRVFVEEGASAKTTEREQFLAMLRHCREHRKEVGSVVVYSVNRFARNSHDHLVVRAHLGSLGIRLLSVTEPLEDSSSGRLLETMLAAFAQFDNDLRSERSVAGLKAALRRGRWTFRPPLGYVARDGKLAIDEHRAPIIRRLFELAASGTGVTQVTREARRLGLAGKTGWVLGVSTMDRLLAQPAYAGIIEIPALGVSSRGGWEPIVDEALYYRARAALTRRAHGPHGSDHPDFPLRRFIRCECGRPLTAAWSSGRGGRRYPYYSCPRRSCKVNLRKDELEGAFVELLESLRPPPAYLRLFRAIVLDVWEKRHQEAAAETETLERRAAELEQRKARLIQAYVYDQVLDRQAYERERDRLGEERAVLGLRQEDAAAAALDVEAVLTYAESLALNVGRMWQQASPENRLRLQRFVFPAGLMRAKDGGLRTGVVASFFSELRDGPGSSGRDGAGNAAGYETIIRELAQLQQTMAA